MTNKIVAIQGDIPSKLNPETDTSIFLANEIQNKRYKIFYYEPKNLSIIHSKVVAKGYFVSINYNKKKFFKVLKKKTLELVKCKFILIRQNPPFNLEYISTTYILDSIKTKVKIINQPIKLGIYKNFLYMEVHAFNKKEVYSNNQKNLLTTDNIYMPVNQVMNFIEKNPSYSIQWKKVFETFEESKGIPIIIGKRSYR